MTRLRRLAGRISGLAGDVLAIAALGLIGFGFGQAPAPWGAMLGPIALGLALIVVVRFGAH